MKDCASEKKRKIDDFLKDVQSKLQELHTKSIANQDKLTQLRARFQANAKRFKAEPIPKVEVEAETNQETISREM